MTKPMTDEMLTDLRERVGQVGCLDCQGHNVDEDEVRALLAEVDRLKANEANLTTLLDQSQADRLAILTENERLKAKLARYDEATDLL